ncbi:MULTISPECIES: p-hydroxycinnamoyl CoA hydratase/lyase [unclassified Novosphingobium]|uniref:p-hydroxycinnamoyl CoA hydratase/lyase n=1 Tax=unclassified Novosphingobium TaxID=2644732 RepID=UPI00086D9CDC|nr:MULTISPECIES: p-hydroxycinnamoyl CoA hydratase/lyase [unclassified Novosphingobium]MBN9145745.1 p-hydroxycinnamoyl CoA hydratase/lyase [Novosphingobium sp.]MDR6706489.1 trans-feruloyl-CoA hydratase/vanillin synthase [Novosphingobium sp. 1748]NKI99163.1 trans-feruloyl-CoA hydratase/vanillin synthase [Novosphingobium sp. SG707]ODU82361.1 MAG: p-hydroxycinnamoyl CoA hydratase/lyase [Novosphingobium sp. SCN 63-17]OJX97138.1 MAG: p-hydroxycinnamoyl CoA hydratase/lyase [Novosphingobium sp. 63-713
MTEQTIERAEEDTVAVHIENRIAWVKYNRPEKRNCMSPKLNRQMTRVLEDLEFREDVGVVVLTGEGSAFSAGMDLQEYFRENEQKGLWATRKAQREAYNWWERLRWYEKPTIGMINGWCFGGAYGPLYAVDIAIASDDAKFGLSEINWGILPGGGASKVAQELMPLRKAMYHAMMGENLTGKQAEAQGLVTESVPHDQLKARVIEIAEALLKKDANALRATKWAMRRMVEMTYDNAEDYLIRAQEALNGFGGLEGRKEATKQFLDDKTFKPGLGTFDITKINK